MKEPEIWKDVQGFEGFYEISTLGRIRSISRLRPTNKKPIIGRVLRLSFNGGRGTNKYQCASITRTNPTIRRTVNIHRLVAVAFVPNPLNKKEVNHKDGNKLNNRSDNLEWATRKENVLHSVENGLLWQNGTHFNAKLTLDKVIQIKKQLAKGIMQYVIADEHNIQSGVVQSISCGRTWKHVTI